jgi:hypothetical protein
MNDVERLAREYDLMVNCSMGWAKGNFARFEKWINRRFVANGPLNWRDICEWESNQCRRPPDAISDCGGGAAAVYWYEIKLRGRLYYFGWPNMGEPNDYFLISVADCGRRRVSVTNYQKVQDV